MVDFRQDTAEGEMLQAFGMARQNAHDAAASLRSRFGLAGASCLPGHRLRAGLPFAAIVGRLNFGMQDEHEQLFRLVN